MVLLLILGTSQVFFDCETSGLSMYKHHITELAAKVVAPSDVSISATDFSALCYPHISASGDKNFGIIYCELFIGIQFCQFQN